MNWTRSQVSEGLVWMAAVLAVVGLAFALVFAILLGTTAGGGSEFIPLEEQSGYLKLRAGFEGGQVMILASIALGLAGTALGRPRPVEQAAAAQATPSRVIAKDAAARPAGPSFSQAVERRSR